MKIFHTGDLHIGMKFTDYGAFAERLRCARTETLDNMVQYANAEHCDLFVIAGDLFDHLRVSRKTVDTVCKSLSCFEGALVAVIAGNHDYDDGYGAFWQIFCELKADNTVVLNQYEPFDLEPYGLNGILHSAYCMEKHSSQNNLSRISAAEGSLNIGIAHGAIEGLSCDREKQYYYMTMQELKESGMDLWLVGHTHVRYPDLEQTTDSRIFNAGTHEPDGWNCTRGGNCWIIEAEKGYVSARAVCLSYYRFYDIVRCIEDEQSMQQLISEIAKAQGAHKVLRLTLSGNCDETLWEKRISYFEQIEALADYTVLRCDAFRKQVEVSDIKQEFSEESFPYKLLMKLSDDEKAFRIAYDFIQEVR